MAERSAKQLGLSQADLPNSVLEVITTLSKSGFEAYLVGGGVRDTLLGLNPKDFDAVTNAKPHEIKDLFGKRCRIIGRRFQLAHVYSGRDMIEVATFRAPPRGDAHTNSDGMIVRDNVWGDIKQDFARRDFTINSLYYQPIKGVVHDFCNALDDIKSKTLKLLGDAPKRIEEDPVRLLRALRFKAKLGFDFDKQLAAQFHEQNWSLLEQVSPHRLYDESQKMFTGGYLVPLLPLLFEYGAIEHLFIYPPKAPSALVSQVAINTDKRIAIGKSINPAFFYAALLWDNYLYQLAKFKKKNMPFQEAQLQAASKVINRQRIKTAIPRFAEQFIRDIWLLQPKLANPRAKQIYKLAEHPRFRAGFDFLLLREQCDDAANPLSESTNGMGAWWQTYQTLSDKQKQQAINDFDADNRHSASKRSRKRSHHKDDKADTDTNDANKQVQSSASYQHKPQPNIDEAKAISTPKKNKRTMSRPQRAHYNRERDQLLKLSLQATDIAGRADDTTIKQPKPLFTIDADKLAKQLPPNVAEQVVAIDNESHNQNTSHKPQQQSKTGNKGDKKSTDKQSTTKQPADKHDAKHNDFNQDDIQQNQDKVNQDKPKQDGINKDNGVNSSQVAVSKGPIPSRRRRRQPSTTVTQIERMAQPSKQSCSIAQGKSAQFDEQIKAKQQSNDAKFASSDFVSTAIPKGRVPAVRRRRQPSSTMTIKQKLAQKS